MEHFNILFDQHKAVRQLIVSVQKHSSSSERLEILNRIRSEIESHTSLEEQFVYPVLENFEPLKREVFGFWREHERLRQELRNLIAVCQDDRQFQTQMIQVNQAFEDHIKEEESRIFPEAFKVVPKDQLVKIDRNLHSAVQLTKKVA
jgi:hypothetical protein